MDVSPIKMKGKKRLKPLATSKSEPSITIRPGGDDPYAGMTLFERNQAKKEALTLSQMNKFSSSMRNMERLLPDPPEVFPKTSVLNESVGKTGATFSEEPKGTSDAGLAERAALGAILNREGALNKLVKVVKTVGKRMREEVADAIDVYRVATVDAVDMIVKWRVVKQDHDAVFMWNGINYLLKIAADVDFIMGFRAVAEWVGFDTRRNPLVVPIPMEEGARFFAKDVMADNAKGVITVTNAGVSKLTEGHTIGGLSQAMVRKYYTPRHILAMYAIKKRKTKKREEEADIFIPANDKIPSGFILKANDPTEAYSIKELEALSVDGDMLKVRQAELVIINEERKFLKLSRAPDGRIAPYLQAQTEMEALELARDTFRDIAEPSVTFEPSLAIHASKSDVGIAERPWQPYQYSQEELKRSSLLDKYDKTITPMHRGQEKVGGAIVSLPARGVESRIHAPLPPTLGNAVDFDRERRKNRLLREVQHFAAQEAELRAEEGILKRDIEVIARLKRTNSASLDSPPSKRPTSRSGPISSTIPLSPAPTSERESGSRESNRSGDESGPEVGSGSSAGGDSAQNDSPDSSLVLGKVVDAPVTDTVDNLNSFGFNKDETKEEHLERLRARLTTTLNILQKSKDDANHVIKDQEKILALKDSQRGQDNRERSRNIERMRRKLTKKQSQRSGPPPEDPPNVYDFFATRCQSAIRKWLARCYVFWYRRVCHLAAATIQAVIRSKLSRNFVNGKLNRIKASVSVQRVFRGYRSRGASAASIADKELAQATLLVQKHWRRVMGTKRLKSKRQLDDSAKAANASVDPRVTTEATAKELAHRLMLSLNQPDVNPYPPEELLKMLRIVVCIVEKTKGKLGQTYYSNLNTRFYREVDGATLTWEDAMSVLNRARRFLRMVRTMAYAPMNKPPRLIQIPDNAMKMYAEIKESPLWKIETFEGIGLGGKMAGVLFTWVNCMLDVCHRQQEFLPFITEPFPPWLIPLYTHQKNTRRKQLEVIITKKTSELLAIMMKEINPRVEKDLAKHMAKFARAEKRDLEELEEEYEELLKKAQSMRDNQSSREYFLLKTMSMKIERAKIVLAEKEVEKKEIEELVAKEDMFALENITRITEEVNILKMNITETTSQYKLLFAQCGRNKSRRDEPSMLYKEVVELGNDAGSDRAMQLLQEAKWSSFVRSKGKRSERNLSKEEREEFKEVRRLAEEKAEIAEKAAKKANDLRRDFDVEIERALAESRRIEELTKEVFVPDPGEMRDEREEDDLVATSERIKRMQYIPDYVLYPELKSPPCIIAIGRDVSGFASKKLIYELDRTMKNKFEFLDVPENMGLELGAMQAILDRGRSIVLRADLGMCRVTRSNFAKNYDIIIGSLFPTPITVFCEGADTNRLEWSGYQQFGMVQSDAAACREAPLKRALERLNAVVHDMEYTPAFRNGIVSYGALPVAPSDSHVVVVQAVFIIQSGHDNFPSFSSELVKLAVWSICASCLLDPRVLALKLMAQKRGDASFHLVECINSFVVSDLWPSRCSAVRAHDLCLHKLATFVEAWVTSRRLTMANGGMAPMGLLKKKVRNCVSVVTVSDSRDDDDSIITERAGGWRRAFMLIVRGCLRDDRPMRFIGRMGSDDPNVYSIEGFRSEWSSFVCVTNIQSGEAFMGSVGNAEVPHLLGANSFDHSLNRIGVVPPQSSKMLCERVLSCMKLRRFSKAPGGRMYLRCEREYDYIMKDNRMYGSYTIYAKCFEASKNELFVTGFMPDRCCHVTLYVSANVRLRMVLNRDGALEKEVDEMVQAPVLAPYAMDRLYIWPPKSLHEWKLDNRDGRGRTLRAEIEESPRTSVSDSVCAKADAIARESKALLYETRDQGFKLKLRTSRGAGRLLNRICLHIGGQHQILTVFSCRKAEVLRFELYEGAHCRVIERRMTKQQRIMLLGECSDRWKVWFPTLIKRLRFDWRGSFDLLVDRTLKKTVRRIQTRQLIVQFMMPLLDDQSVDIEIIDSELCMRFATRFDKSMLAAILKCARGEVEQKDAKRVGKKKKNASSPAKRNPMASGGGKNDLVAGVAPSTGDVEAVDRPGTAASVTSVESVDAAEVSIVPTCLELNEKMQRKVEVTDEEAGLPLEVLVSTENMNLISRFLVRCLSRVNIESAVDGYYLAEPMAVVFPPSNVKPPHQAALDMTPRKFQRLRKAPLEVSIQGVIRSRRQIPLVNMEAALEDLAKEKMEKAAKVKAEVALCGGRIDADRAQIAAERQKEVEERERERALEAAAEAAERKLAERGGGSQSLAGSLDDDTSVGDSTVGGDLSTVMTHDSIADMELAEEIFDVVEDMMSMLVLDASDIDRASCHIVLRNTITKLEADQIWRESERLEPGFMLAEKTKLETRLKAEAAAKKREREDLIVRGLLADVSEEEEVREILIPDEDLIFERKNIEVSFKEGLGRSKGRTDVYVYQGTSWCGAGGLGKKYRFCCTPVGQEHTYEGWIKSIDHLREILGDEADDLADTAKVTEMLLFVCRYRLDIARTNFTVDGTPVPAEDQEGMPYYRVELAPSLPPVVKETEKKNEDDVDLGKTKGKKLIRTVRRVSGVLLNLTVFEILTDEDMKREQEEFEEKRKNNTLNKIAEEKKRAKDMHRTGQVAEVKHERSEKGRHKLKLSLPPMLRIVAQDPKSKKSHAIFAVPGAVRELAGGGFSKFLDRDRRKELARIMVEHLVLVFQKDGITYDLLLPWSEADPELMGRLGGDKNSWRAALMRERERRAILDNKTRGTIFRTRMKITGTECVISVITDTAPRPPAPPESTPPSAPSTQQSQVPGGPQNLDGVSRPGTGATASRPATAASGAGGTAEGEKKEKKGITMAELRARAEQKKNPNAPVPVSDEQAALEHALKEAALAEVRAMPGRKRIIAIFYNRDADTGGSIEREITPDEQRERLGGKCVLEFMEGPIREAAIRRLLGCFSARVEDDVADRLIKHLRIELEDRERSYVSDYLQVGLPEPGDEYRPVGMPEAFMPLDTRGELYVRRALTLEIQDPYIGKYQKEFVTSVYSKRPGEGVELGIVISMYDATASQTGVLHVSKNEVRRLCNVKGRGDVVDKMVEVRNKLNNFEDDGGEEAFVMLTAKGDLLIELRDLTDIIMDFVLGDVGVKVDPQDKSVPYLRSAKIQCR